MNKKELTQALTEYVNAPFISREELMKCFGYKNRRSMDYILVGMDKVGNRYFIPDVAERIILKGLK